MGYAIRSRSTERAIRHAYKPDHCVSGKRCYGTKRKARRVLDAIREQARSIELGGVIEARTEQSIYRCPHCRFWHLTKQKQGR